MKVIKRRGFLQILKALAVLAAGICLLTGCSGRVDGTIYLTGVSRLKIEVSGDGKIKSVSPLNKSGNALLGEASWRGEEEDTALDTFIPLLRSEDTEIVYVDVFSESKAWENSEAERLAEKYGSEDGEKAPVEVRKVKDFDALETVWNSEDVLSEAEETSEQENAAGTKEAGETADAAGMSGESASGEGGPGEDISKEDTSKEESAEDGESAAQESGQAQETNAAVPASRATQETSAVVSTSRTAQERNAAEPASRTAQETSAAATRASQPARARTSAAAQNSRTEADVTTAPLTSSVQETTQEDGPRVTVPEETLPVSSEETETPDWSAWADEEIPYGPGYESAEAAQGTPAAVIVPEGAAAPENTGETMESEEKPTSPTISISLWESEEPYGPGWPQP